MANLVSELRRRNVFRVAGLYLVVSWLLLQLAAFLEDALKLPDWFDGMVTALVLLGFPVALILAWAFELTPAGVRRTAASESSAPVRPRLPYCLLRISLPRGIRTIFPTGSPKSYSMSFAATRAFESPDGRPRLRARGKVRGYSRSRSR